MTLDTTSNSNNNNDISTIKGLGWVPDTPDARDQMFSITKPELLKALPSKIDLRVEKSMQFPMLDQGELGSCTANAISGAMTYATTKKQQQTTTNVFIPSRLFI